VITVLAQCFSDQIILPLNTRREIMLDKDEFGFFVIFLDLLGIFISTVFIFWLKDKQKHFVNEFKKQTI
jgi:hypothetical protein